MLREILRAAWATIERLASPVTCSTVKKTPRRARRRSHYTGGLSLVRQVDRLGCGLACVAMIAGVEYAEAKSVVKSRKRRGAGNATRYADLRHGLDSFGVRYATNGRRAFRFTSWADLPDRAIVNVECGPPWPGSRHWIAFDRVRGDGFILDPDRPGVVRTSVRGLRAKSYITILPAE